MLQPQGLAVGLGRGHQGPADLHAQVVALGFGLGQRQQEAAAGAADIQVNRPIRLGEQRLGLRQLQGLLEEAAERIDVLAHHQAGSGWSRGTTKAQLAV